MKTFSSVLATTIRDYLTLKRALGREYEREEWVLARLDRFLAARHADLIAETFAAWCLTLQNLASGVRRGQMRHVRNLCLYRRRREPGCFVPDERLFPPLHQVIQPHIFTDAQVAQLLAVARTLTRTSNSPLCPENMRLAVVLLYTTGLRRGELARLTVRDYDSHQRILVIRASKFHKSRLVPLSADAAREIDQFLEIRRQRRFPTAHRIEIHRRPRRLRAEVAHENWLAARHPDDSQAAGDARRVRRVEAPRHLIRERRPFGMGREPRPRVLRQQLFAERDLA